MCGVRVLVCVLFACAALGPAATEAAPRPAAAVTVTVWPKGNERGKPSRTWTLRCAPAGGTLPNPARACRALLADRALLRPVPDGTACTQIYGGPQVALVRGRVGGRRVRVTYSRSNGCEIARWNALSPLFTARA